MEHHDNQSPIFLGLAERAAYVRESNTNLFKWNVLGLKSIILSNIFPMRLSGWTIGLVFSPGTIDREHRLSIADEAGKDLGYINISGGVAASNDLDAVLDNEGPGLLVPQLGWSTIFLPLGDTGIVIERPGVVHLRHVTESGSSEIGELRFVVVPPPPLTEERIAAIKSNPSAVKAVRMEFGCQFCASKCRIYAAIERSEKSEREGWIWYREAPEVFNCSCGKTTFSLEIVRSNLHGFLGHLRGDSTDVSFVPMYERSSLETLRTNFAELLHSNPKEERLQQFLETNPILLHQFPSFRLLSKPPILTSYFADFAMVTPNKELLLIELEKTSTKLMKKDGGLAADLGHAFDQVRSWLHLVDEHRLSVLDSLKIDREEVSTVKGVVIAGRDIGYDAHNLRRLKGEDRGRISFFTYDDLLFALDVLIRRMGQL